MTLASDTGGPTRWIVNRRSRRDSTIAGWDSSTEMPVSSTTSKLRMSATASRAVTSSLYASGKAFS